MKYGSRKDNSTVHSKKFNLWSPAKNDQFVKCTTANHEIQEPKKTAVMFIKKKKLTFYLFIYFVSRLIPERLWAAHIR